MLIGADREPYGGQGEPIAWPVASAGHKGYPADWIDQYVLELGIQPVIPSKAGEHRNAMVVSFYREAYRYRDIVERLVGGLEECRRIFSRFGKPAKNFGGMVKTAFAQRHLKPAAT